MRNTIQQKILSIMVLLLILLFSNNLFAQKITDTIITTKEWGTNVYYLNYQKLKVRKLVKILKSNELAYAEIKKARNSYIISTVIGAVGGYVLGGSLAVDIIMKKVYILPTATGVGLIGLSYGLVHRYNVKSKNAVSIFNEEIQSNYNIE